MRGRPNFYDYTRDELIDAMLNAEAWGLTALVDNIWNEVGRRESRYRNGMGLFKIELEAARTRRHNIIPDTTGAERPNPPEDNSAAIAVMEGLRRFCDVAGW